MSVYLQSKVCTIMERPLQLCGAGIWTVSAERTLQTMETHTSSWSLGVFLLDNTTNDRSDRRWE